VLELPIEYISFKKFRKCSKKNNFSFERYFGKHKILMLVNNSRYIQENV